MQLGGSMKDYQLLTGKRNQFITEFYAGLQTWSDYFEMHMQRKMDLRFGTQKIVTFIK
jgi:hypothetical protein